jgi:NADP-dependent 3-hydroxy acid dehydrogenase YdfG
VIGALDGRRVAVSGASSGIGLAVVRALHDLGAHVTAWARRAEAIAEGAGAQRRASGRLEARRLDVTVARAVAQEGARLDRLDVLVAAAGTNIPDRALGRLRPEGVRELVDTNLTGVVQLVAACLPALRAARGLVIVVGSVSGVWPDTSGPAYQATKAGVLAFARGAGLEEQEHSVRFSVVQPGLVDTPLLDRRPEPPPAERRAAALRPEDVAAACAYLATLPPRVLVPELTLLPAALQVPGRTA